MKRKSWIARIPKRSERTPLRVIRVVEIAWRMNEGFAAEGRRSRRKRTGEGTVHNSPWIAAANDASRRNEWRFERIVISYWWQFPFACSKASRVVFSYPCGVIACPGEKAMGTGRKWKDGGRTRPGERDAMQFNETVNRMEWCPNGSLEKCLLFATKNRFVDGFDGLLRPMIHFRLDKFFSGVCNHHFAHRME